MSLKPVVTIGGASTHMLLQFPESGKFLYMGSVLTLSYQVYRNKTPVFNCGEPTVDGFAIGNKYIAGTIVSTMFSEDELTSFIQENSSASSEIAEYDQYRIDRGSLKRMRTYMKDDATSFNIHVLFTSEYSEAASRIIIYDATFINNSQVMSINDLITEQTASFVAKDIREQHPVDTPIGSVVSANHRIRKASNLV